MDDWQYRLPRQIFERTSDVFRTTFALPPPTETDKAEGSCPENPVHLRGIKKDDFEALLKVMFPYVLPCICSVVLVLIAEA